MGGVCILTSYRHLTFLVIQISVPPLTGPIRGSVRAWEIFPPACGGFSHFGGKRNQGLLLFVLRPAHPSSPNHHTANRPIHALKRFNWQLHTHRANIGRDLLWLLCSDDSSGYFRSTHY